MSFSIYLAGKVPKGKKECEDFVDWRQEFQALCEKNRDSTIQEIVYLDPNAYDYNAMPIEKFFGRDSYLIKKSKLLLVDARQKIGAGTAQEILIAKYFKVPVVTVVPNQSHYKKKVFVHGEERDYVHPFIFSTSDIIVEDFEEAANWILGYISKKNVIDIKDISVIDKEIEHFYENYYHKDVHVKKWDSKLD